MELADKIRVHRERLGLNQAQMADKLYMTTTGYGKIERNEVSINQERLQQIAKIFGVSVKDLVSEEEIALSKQTEIQYLQMIIQEKDKRIQSLEREIKYLHKIAQLDGNTF